MIIPDLRGHGDSEKVNVGIDVATFAQDLAALRSSRVVLMHRAGNRRLADACRWWAVAATQR